MAFRTRVGWSNLLTRRVMRHRSIAVLYRVAAPMTLWSAEREPPTPPEPALGDSDIVLAHLVSPDVQTPTQALTMAPVIPPSASRTVGSPPQISPQAPVARRAEGPISSAAPSFHSPPADAEVQTTTVFRSPPEEKSSASAEQTTPTDQDTTLTDDVWRRLQTIFRRHQEKASVSSTSTPQSISAASGSRETVTSQGTPAPSPMAAEPPRPDHQVQPEMEKTETLVTPSAQHIEQTDIADIVQSRAIAGEMPGIPPERPASPTLDGEATGENVATQVQSAPVSPGGKDSSVPPRTQSAVQAPPMPPSIEALPPTPLTLTEELARTTSESARAASAPPSTESIQKQDAQARGSLESVSNQVPPQETSEEPQQAPIPQQTTRRDLADMPKGETAAQLTAPRWSVEETSLERPTQPIPLHEVWHVERVLPGAAAAAPVIPEPGEPESEPETSQQDQSSIKEILSNIAAAGFTRSSVEILPPRRPRPTTPRTRLATAPAPDTVRSKVAERPPVPLHTENTTSVGATAQVRPRTATPPQHLIETEIGPLPNDLWSLIGEPPPVSRSDKPRLSSVSVSPASNVDRMMASVPSTQAQFTPTRPTARKEVEHWTQRGANVIRRTPDETAQAETSATADEEASTTQVPSTELKEAQQREETTPEETLDIESLARRVYSEIRRRLHIESERARRR